LWLAGRPDARAPDAVAFIRSWHCCVGRDRYEHPINPIAALYWSAVVNGVAAVPIMVLLMLMTARRQVMGDFNIGGWLQFLGWIATLAMLGSVVGMLGTALV
jgi:Mn2+/Fe2+ NRAMP family transporter